MIAAVRMRSLVIAATLFLPACSSKSGGPSGPGVGGADDGGSARCEALGTRVADLYRGETPADTNPELAAELVEANTHMVISDCSANPARAIPCIESSRTVQSLESNCVIPLDDEGTVEGAAFSASNR